MFRVSFVKNFTSGLLTGFAVPTWVNYVEPHNAHRHAISLREVHMHSDLITKSEWFATEITVEESHEKV